MLDKNEITGLIIFLQTIKRKVYHACQLQDFLSYTKLQGIPSRNLLASLSMEYTGFDTDAKDKVANVWDLVFGNMNDFGNAFANGGNGTPNAYGPIMLVMDPTCLNDAIDVAICKRSASASDFCREKEALSLEEIYELYQNQSKGHSPELSCRFLNELMPLSHLAYIIVDPYCYERFSLRQVVLALLGQTFYDNRVLDRKCNKPDRVLGYQILFDSIANGVTNLAGLAQRPDLTSDVIQWIKALNNDSIQQLMFQRYAKYLRHGTINTLMKMIQKAV